MTAVITHKESKTLSTHTGLPRRNYYVKVMNEEREYPIKRGKKYSEYIDYHGERVLIYANTDIYDQFGRLPLVRTENGFEQQFDYDIVGKADYGRWIYAETTRLNPDIIKKKGATP